MVHTDGGCRSTRATAIAGIVRVFHPGIDHKDINDTTAENKATYEVKKAKLDSQEFTSDIGSNKSVSLTFTAQVGGPNQTK